MVCGEPAACVQFGRVDLCSSCAGFCCSSNRFQHWQHDCGDTSMLHNITACEAFNRPATSQPRFYSPTVLTFHTVSSSTPQSEPPWEERCKMGNWQLLSRWTGPTETSFCLSNREPTHAKPLQCSQIRLQLLPRPPGTRRLGNAQHDSLLSHKFSTQAQPIQRRNSTSSSTAMAAATRGRAASQRLAC